MINISPLRSPGNRLRADVLDLPGSGQAEIHLAPEVAVHRVEGDRRALEADDDRILDSSRVIMGDETEAHTLSGNSILINGKLQQVGFSVDLLPRIHKATIDLTIVVVHSQPVTNQPNSTADVPQASSVSIQTNFALGGRFQLPRESAAIFVLHSASGANQRDMGLLITPQVMQPKK